MKIIVCIIHLSLCLLTISCKESLEIDNGKVTTVLATYAKEHPEMDIIIKTSEGDIPIKLYDDTPLHRANFIRLIKNRHFDAGVFYRSIQGFMIQGGNTSAERYKYLIPSEILKHNICKKGALCMAHYDEGNPQNNSSATEFFIVHGQKLTPFAIKEDHLKLDSLQLKYYTTIGGDYHLDGKYTVFGEVISEGFNTLDKIANAPINGEETPVNPVKFKIVIR